MRAVAGLAILMAGLPMACSKPRPPLVVTLKGESPDGSDVRHTIIAVRAGVRMVVLNMEVLTPADFVDYRATLKRGAEMVTSEEHLKMGLNEVIRMDVDAEMLTPGEYSLVVEARDDMGKMYPFSTYNFRTIR